MSNPYFRFKQFTIYQDRCAMKVSTDGVLLGAWIDTTNCQQILDIGTGTGLIALMLAQRNQTAQIDAIEIDAEACAQAQDNIARSPWSERIQVHHQPIQDYAASCLKRYDLLITNPPFFENASKAKSPSRTVARHSDSLQQSDLLRVAEQLLKEEGRLAVIYPNEEANSFQAKAQVFNLFCNQKLLVKTTPKMPIKRVLMQLSKSQSDYEEAMLTLEIDKHVYTTDYITLIKDFYLNY